LPIPKLQFHLWIIYNCRHSCVVGRKSLILFTG
jgi:hypothetical protein